MTVGKKPLTVTDLCSLEHYSRIRSRFRAQAAAHLERHRVQLGEHLVLCFEDKLTVQFQIQEVLRSARIFEHEKIQAELDAYEPLMPDVGKLKATMMLQTDQKEDLADCGERIWIQPEDAPRIYASSDYNLTGRAAVQWLVFEGNDKTLDPSDNGTLTIKVGVEHKRYCHQDDLKLVDCTPIVNDLMTDDFASVD